MPRRARQASESSIYHVVNRGAGKQIIFETDADRAFFMSQLSEMLEDKGGELLAWCLMENHIHLLVKMRLADLSDFMHDLKGVYAGYFNRVYGRTGPLFEGRFKSEPVESDEYLMTVVRYIHENPCKAHLTQGLSFKWSSYNEYLYRRRYIQPSLVLDVFGGLECFKDFHAKRHDDEGCLDVEEPAVRLPEDRALSIARDVCGQVSIHWVKALPRDERDGILCKLKENGLSVRQIQRLTGLSIGCISRANTD